MNEDEPKAQKKPKEDVLATLGIAFVFADFIPVMIVCFGAWSSDSRPRMVLLGIAIVLIVAAISCFAAAGRVKRTN